MEFYKKTFPIDIFKRDIMQKTEFVRSRINMKRIISVLVIISAILISVSSCSGKKVNAPTCEELIAAYEDAGYNVFHSDNEYKDDGNDYNCYVKIWLEDEYDYVFYYFFDTSEAAEKMDSEREYNVLVYMFSVIYGDPSWLHTETYGSIEYEYENKDLLKPFNELVKQSK